MSHKRRQYTSEISEKQWERLAWMLPKSQRGRPLELDLRVVMNAILYVLVTGSQWRNLPEHQTFFANKLKWVFSVGVGMLYFDPPMYLIIISQDCATA